MKLLRRILCAVSLFFFMLGQWKEAAVDGVPLKTSCRCCGCHRSLSSAAAARKQSAAKRAAAIAEGKKKHNYVFVQPKFLSLHIAILQQEQRENLQVQRMQRHSQNPFPKHQKKGRRVHR